LTKLKYDRLLLPPSDWSLEDFILHSINPSVVDEEIAKRNQINAAKVK
jgi:hypothetical protein